jgi:hypothetical protein
MDINPVFFGEPVRMNRYLTPFLIVVLAATTGCTTTVTQEFRRNPDSVVETSYIATDADFSSYDRLTGAEMGIFFPQNSAIPEADLTRMRTIFRTAFLDELANYTVVADSGPGIMLIEASLIDLRNASYNDIPNLRREVQEVAAPGSMVFLMELKDSDSGRVLGRAVDSSRNPNIGIDQLDETEWQEVETAAGHWARLFRQFLDQNLNK